LRSNGPRFGSEIALCLAAGTLAAAPVALAHGGGGEGGGYGGYGDSAQVEITGSIPGTCEFTTTPDQTALGTLATGLEKETGNLGFTCNLATTSSVNLTVKSQNGALKRDGGTETVAYQVAWNIQGFTNVYFTIPTTTTPFNLLSGPTGIEQLGLYKVKVTGATAGKPAGTYKDVVSYTISP